MPETIILIISSDEEENERDGAVICKEVEEDSGSRITDPVGFDDEYKVLLGVEPLIKKRRRRRRRKKKITRYIEFQVAQAQLNVDNSKHKRDSCNDRGLPLFGTETSKLDESQNLVQTETLEDRRAGNLFETESNEIENNFVLRQLLRRPRYFDPPGSSWILCLRCGEESHTEENCTLQKKKKPCYCCASFEHSSKCCRQLSREVLKGKEIVNHSFEELHVRRLSSLSCLRCGDSGHDLFSCGNDYSAEDLKEIQCYVCKSYGHLCCVDFPASDLIQVSCYNCGQSGHLGSVCTEQCPATDGSRSPAMC